MRVWFVKIGSFDDLLEKPGPQSFSQSYNWFSLYWSTSKPFWNFLCLLKVTTVCKKTKQLSATPIGLPYTAERKQNIYCKILLNISFIHKRRKIRIILTANCQRHYHSGLIKARIWLKRGQPLNTWAKLRMVYITPYSHLLLLLFIYFIIIFICTSSFSTEVKPLQKIVGRFSISYILLPLK